MRKKTKKSYKKVSKSKKRRAAVDKKTKHLKKKTTKKVSKKKTSKKKVTKKKTKRTKKSKSMKNYQHGDLGRGIEALIDRVGIKKVTFEQAHKVALKVKPDTTYGRAYFSWHKNKYRNDHDL